MSQEKKKDRKLNLTDLDKIFENMPEATWKSPKVLLIDLKEFPQELKELHILWQKDELLKTIRKEAMDNYLEAVKKQEEYRKRQKEEWGEESAETRQKLKDLKEFEEMRLRRVSRDK